MKTYPNFIRFLCVVVMALLLPKMALAATKIQAIDIQGQQRIEEQTILSYLDLRIGDDLSPATMDHGLKSLFATGLFADVKLVQDESTLNVEVVENPVINQIVFEGNDKVDDDELLAETSLRPRQVFTRTKVQSDVMRLHQVYHRNGRFAAQIEPKVIKLDQNRVDLIFEVEEGDVTTISSIRFIGNKRFTDEQLRGEIRTQESKWYSFMTVNDRYDPDLVAYDEELLRRFYTKEGYADFRLLSSVAELSSTRDSFYLTFTVEEGERYKFADVTINSDLRDFDPTVLDPLVNVQAGDWYDSSRIQEISDKLSDKLGDLQYAFVNIKPQPDKNREDKTVAVTFRIQESPKSFVERIEVDGNIRTLDKVVRREMLLVEGDPFNRSKVSRSQQRIRDLDYFETVDFQVKPGSAPDKTVIDIDVAEKSTGELSLGAGYSSTDGPLADFRIRERNFLGKGQSLSLGAVLAGDKTEFDLGFTEPHFLDRDLSAGVDAFHVTRDFQDESSYDQRRTGGGLRVGYPLSERWRQNLGYRYERNEITDVQENASRIIRDQSGVRKTSALSLNTTYDNRDSRIFPTDGWLLWLNTELAGLGGDAKYVSAKTGASFYYPLADKIVFNAMTELGAITSYGDSYVAINERFFLGGGTLRGFEQAGVGPRDSLTDDSLGGNTFYRGSLEVSFPMGFPEEMGVLGHAFNDFGSLSEIDETGAEIIDERKIRASAGLGMSWRSPFGPIRFDYAIPYAKEDYDEEEHFRFNFGTRF